MESRRGKKKCSCNSGDVFFYALRVPSLQPFFRPFGPSSSSAQFSQSPLELHHLRVSWRFGHWGMCFDLASESLAAGKPSILFKSLTFSLVSIGRSLCCLPRLFLFRPASHLARHVASGSSTRIHPLSLLLTPPLQCGRLLLGIDAREPQRTLKHVPAFMHHHERSALQLPNPPRQPHACRLLAPLAVKREKLGHPLISKGCLNMDDPPALDGWTSEPALASPCPRCRAVCTE